MVVVMVCSTWQSLVVSVAVFPMHISLFVNNHSTVRKKNIHGASEALLSLLSGGTWCHCCCDCRFRAYGIVGRG